MTLDEALFDLYIYQNIIMILHADQLCEIFE